MRETIMSIIFAAAYAALGWVVGFVSGRTVSRRHVRKWTDEALAEATADMDRRRAAWATRTIQEIVDAKRDGVGKKVANGHG